MDFGRLENIEHIDFTLPADHKSVSKVLGGSPSLSPKVYVGGVLWASDSFPGTIYPPKARPADFVKYYTQQFNTIELNATHYKIQPPQTFRRWAEVAPEGFKFCPKFHQDVSHADNLLAMTGFQQQSNELFSLFGTRLGPAFMQLPPHFSVQRGDELVSFLNQCGVPGMAVELRHPSWFVSEQALNGLCNFLYKKTISLVLTDTPGRRDVLHLRLTNKTAFVRFNGHNQFEGDKARIDAWINKARQWFELGLENFYFFVHTPRQLFMPALVTYFTESLQNRCGLSVNPPVLYNSGATTGFIA